MIGAVSFVAKEYPFPVVCLRPAHFAIPVPSWPIFTLAPPGALIDIAGHDFAGRYRSKKTPPLLELFSICLSPNGLELMNFSVCSPNPGTGTAAVGPWR